ncbi:Nucleoprotein/polynucleotide-associated enzyme [hydrothermal vent metagenome]|uniref:Nucleoprotein/polynucleotide-associated enzyme n=1 Tax=hydrothermal vent metagenome TaxID=652676 RepID=A0A3B1B5T4_9ZZZZ
MNNPFQEQLLKAGVVSKQQVQKANKAVQKKKKQQRNVKQAVADEAQLKARQATKEKARHDRELNQRKEEQARKKAISAEINQLITANRIERSEQCDIVYNFEHQQKVKRIYINDAMKQQIIQGKLGIARIDGRYELVPKIIAEKIQQRNEKRIILFDNTETEVDENDPYADFKVPDDLVW